jgi:ubiquinone/menaquinone biosynthesis C-methylase UbiE
MEVRQLLEHLEVLSKKSNQEFMQNMEERKIKELIFHDRDRDKNIISTLSKDAFEKYYSNIKYYKTVQLSIKYKEEWLKKNVKGKIFLDYACGNGENAMFAAHSGAKLAIGIDISLVSINNAKEAAAKMGLKNTYFLQADAEDTKLPTSSIDRIICSGMLHHLDLSFSLAELRRILKPYGKILVIEALNYNPAIKLYRKITPMMRTEWEKTHILDLKDVEFARYFFDIGEIKFWHITSYLGAIIPGLLNVFNMIDSILCRIPYLNLMAWIFTFELIGEKQELPENP